MEQPGSKQSKPVLYSVCIHICLPDLRVCSTFIAWLFGGTGTSGTLVYQTGVALA